MPSMPYRQDRRQNAQYDDAIQDDGNAPDVGGPPKPQPYRPATQQPKDDAQPQQPPTFTQLQETGQARPPMPPQQPQVTPVQSYANTKAPAPVQFGNQAPLAQGPNTLASYAPQGNVGSFGAGAAGKVFDESGNPVDAAQLPQGRLTPEAQQRLASGFSVRLMPGGGASYIANEGTNPAGLVFGQGDGTVTRNAPYTYQPQAAPQAAIQAAPQAAAQAHDLTQLAMPSPFLTPEDQELFGGSPDGAGGNAGPDTGVTFTPPPAQSGGPLASPQGGGLDPNTPPNPPTNAPTGAPNNPATPNNYLTPDILRMLLGGAERQNPYSQQQMRDQYDWYGGQIDDQYDVQRQQLGEEMARRGLGASTIYGGRLNDTNIGQRTAKQNLAVDLADKQAGAAGQTSRDNLDYIRSLIGYGQQGFENDMITAQFDRQGDQAYWDFIQRILGGG